jgi:hypothetical protein
MPRREETKKTLSAFGGKNLNDHNIITSHFSTYQEDTGTNHLAGGDVV